jgi:hypothetical protein
MNTSVARCPMRARRLVVIGSVDFAHCIYELSVNSSSPVVPR